jgi:hypothetical protein
MVNLLEIFPPAWRHYFLAPQFFSQVEKMLTDTLANMRQIQDEMFQILIKGNNKEFVETDIV